ncbi:MAG: efflux RND transporter periplasmic adaptor subunit [Dyadobacter sp.]
MQLKIKNHTAHARQGLSIHYALFCILLALTSCKKDPQKLKPSLEPVTESVYASGIVKSKNQYQVYAAATGILSKILVSKGDIVSKGTPLMLITNTTAKLNTENALLNAQYSSSVSNKEKFDELSIAIELAKTKLDDDLSLLQRQKNLWAQKVGTRNDLDARQLAYTSSENAYQTAKLRFTELQKQISFQQKQSRKTLEISKTTSGDYTVRSQWDGKVYDILKKTGEMVNTLNPVALVGDANDFLLELQIDEYDITRIQVGQKMLLTMDSYKGLVFQAVVSKVIPVMNERSKSFTVEAGFIKPPAVLYPNLTCEANIVIREKKKALTIPRNYLMSGDYVLLGNNQKRSVVTGLKDYQKVEIISGLQVSDVIIMPQE